MKLTLDKRKTNIIVIDKELLQHNTNDEVIKLIIKPDDKAHNFVTDMIGRAIGLIDSERELYHIIVNYSLHKTNNTKEVNIKDAIDASSRLYNKSRVTYQRALDVLIKRGIVRYSDGNKVVVINPEYDCSTIDNAKARSIVIEIAGVGY